MSVWGLGVNGRMSYRRSILKSVFCFNFFLRGKSHVRVDGFMYPVSPRRKVCMPHGPILPIDAFWVKSAGSVYCVESVVFVDRCS